MHTHGTRTTEEERGLNSYPSPPVAIQALMAHEALPHTVWECACGDGTGMVLPMRATGRKVLASDIVDRGCPDSSINDFMTSSFAPITPAIVTNPPYDDVDRFIHHALDLAPDVYMLLRLTYLEGVDGGKHRGTGLRSKILERSGLRRVLIFRERLPNLHREGWEGKKSTNPTAYAWFCWRRDWKGKRAIDRISCKEIGPPLPPPGPRGKMPKGYDPHTFDMFDGVSTDG